MIIYGWNSKSLKQATIDFIECPGCKEKPTLMAIFAHYVHIFWIPLFPYKKSLDIVCSKCEYVIREHDLEGDQKTAIKKLKSTVSMPWYLFSGLILIGVLTAYLIFDSSKKSIERSAWIESPQAGDVYLLLDPDETQAYNHFLLKVYDVVDDTLWVSTSYYSYNGIVTALDPKDGFYDMMFPIHKSWLAEKEESGDLKRVFRDYDENTGFNRVIEYVEPDSAYIAPDNPY